MIVNLLTHTPALAYAESLVGKTHDVWAGQIALRFPGDGCFDAKKMINSAQGTGLQALINNPLIGGVVQQIVGNDDEEAAFRIPPTWEKFWHM